MIRGKKVTIRVLVKEEEGKKGKTVMESPYLSSQVKPFSSKSVRNKEKDSS